MFTIRVQKSTTCYVPSKPSSSSTSRQPYVYHQVKWPPCGNHPSYKKSRILVYVPVNVKAMKNHLTILGLSIAICTFLVAQGNVTGRTVNSQGAVAFQQDTSKHHKGQKKKWKKMRDTSYNRSSRDTSMMDTTSIPR